MKTKLQNFCILLALLAGVHRSAAQGTTAFTYQGQLHDSTTNANGTYTMIFALYDSVSGGNQIGSTITTSPTLANGLFTVNLDFGNVFTNGNASWLDITITNGGATQELSPRVQVLPTPYAQFAALAGTVTNGAIMNAQLAPNAVANANIISVNGSKVAGAVALANLATNVVSGITITNAFITNAIFAGNGAGLTNIIHPLIIPVTANYTVSANDVNGMQSSNIVYSIQSSPFTGSPLVFTFPMPPAQPVQFTLLLAGTNAITLASPNGTTFVVSSGNGLANSNSISMSGYFGKSETWENTNGTTWQMIANSRTLQEEQDIAANYVGVTNQNGIGLTNIPASAIVGLLYKAAVQEATTSNLPPYGYNNAAGTITGANVISLGPLSIDGITVTPGDSVLVKNESSSAFNGIYVCTANATQNNFSLTRRSDFNTATNLDTGDMVSVVQGAVNANTTWFLKTSGPITIGTTPLTFALQLPASIFSTATGLALANGVVTNANLTANAVATINIQNGAITTVQIATNAVNATNIASGQVVKTLNGLTDFITITNGANTALFTNGNSLQISAVVPNVVGFTSSGTFTVPTNVTRIKVEIWGGGGGGGNGSSSYPGGGGGAGGYIFNVFNVTPGTSYTVTIGSGGNAGASGTSSSFGALMSAAGGHAGSAGGSGGSGAGGSGGTTSGGVGPLVGSAGDGGSTFTGAGGNGASAAGDLGGSGGWGDAGSPPGNNSNGNGAGGGGGAAGGGGGGTGGGGLVVVYY